MRRSSILPLIFRGCKADPCCERRYDPLIGYYAGVRPTKTYKTLCLTHFSSLYVRDYDAVRHLRRYACSVQGCENATEWLPAIPGSSWISVP